MDFYESLLTYCGYAFSPAQRKAISHYKGPALTLAVPGSGKTTLLLARTVHLVHVHKIPPERILTMTFSKAASLDMDHRFKATYHKHYPFNLQFSTIHSFCWKVLKTYRAKKGLGMTLLEGSVDISKMQVLSQIYRQLTKDYLGEEQYEELSNQLGFAKNMMLLPSEFAQAGLKFPHLSKIYEAYEAYKQKNDCLDFDDLLSETLAAIQTDASLLETIRKTYPFIQIDETQDTSKLQHEIIKRIAYPENNVFVVADDDQSIYGFRGATPELILKFESLYPKRSLYHLETNYRSKDEILNLCSKSIINNINRYKKTLVGNRGTGGLTKLSYFTELDDRNDYLIGAIQEQLKSPAATDIGILYRNNMSAISIADRLIEANIPFHLKDGKQKTSNKWIVKDLEAFYALSTNPTQLSAFEKICYRTNARISKDLLEYVRLNHRGRNIFDCLIEAPGVNGYKAKIIRSLETHVLNIRHMNAFTALNVIEKEIGYGEFMAYASDQMGYSKIGIQNLWASLKAIARRQPHLEGLFERLLILDSVISEQKKTQPVKLSTIHSAKGQEFDTVFLVDINEGLLPAGADDDTSGDSIEEDRRLFYVALSRAKNQLEILHARFMNESYVQPSRFVKEIEKNMPVQIIKDIAAPAPQVDIPDTIAIGKKITHTMFGLGQIIDLNGDRITIGFDDKIRDLSLRVCLEKGLIK